MRRLLVFGFLALVLVGCGAAPEAAAPTPVVVTQIVKETVLVKETVVVTPTPKPVTPTAPPPTATHAPAGGKWQLNEDTSSFDDSKTVVLVLDANNDISGPVNNYRPSLILRCKEKATEVYVNTGMQPDVEGVSDTATVRLRFDKEQAETLQAGKSTSGESLFLEPPLKLIESMLGHEQMVFQFTPFSAAPAEMTFDLRGLKEVITPLREACP